MATRIRIVQVPPRSFPHEEGDEPVVADHVAEAWIAEGTAEPYERKVERAVRTPEWELSTSPEAYLERYPDGPNAELARELVEGEE